METGNSSGSSKSWNRKCLAWVISPPGSNKADRSEIADTMGDTSIFRCVAWVSRERKKKQKYTIEQNKIYMEKYGKNCLDSQKSVAKCEKID